jgi:outer membrane receptor protein involved in Fe transport
VNLFGGDGSITPAMIPYITAEAGTKQLSSLAQARALLSGDVGASSPFAEDPIGFAVGGEYRRYAAAQRADQLSQTAGELGGAGGAVQNFDGAYEVYEGYAEVIAPLVQNRPFFRSLTLEAGVRYSDYKVEAPGNPSYSTTTYKLAGSWEPFDGLRFRGNYQRAVRAPNINELFAPVNVGLTNLSTDPCRGTNPARNPRTDAALRAVCLAQGAPAAAIDLGSGILNPTAAQANATTAGGLYLRPEKADSYTVGVVFQPEFVSGLSITVDYYNIKINDAISQPTPGDLVTNCFGDSNGTAINAGSVNNPACQLFRRDPVTGQLSGDPATTGGLVFPSSNSGRITTDGIDVGINYRRDLGFARLNLSFIGNWTNKSTFQSTVAGSTIPVGYPGAGTVVPNASATRECVSFYGPNCGSPGSAGPNSSPGSLQPEFTWNQRTTLSFGDIDNFDLTLTVQNLLDKSPPIVGSTVGSTSFNSGNTYPSTYDALGRRLAVGARLKF